MKSKLVEGKCFRENASGVYRWVYDYTPVPRLGMY
jgi:hypothetical protein